ncbi:hypothetical protein AOLI_G00198890, partial [Acnodon oligacanthus]
PSGGRAERDKSARRPTDFTARGPARVRTASPSAAGWTPEKATMEALSRAPIHPTLQTTHFVYRRAFVVLRAPPEDLLLRGPFPVPPRPIRRRGATGLHWITEESMVIRFRRRSSSSTDDFPLLRRHRTN